jgi:hypothetical protein
LQDLFSSELGEEVAGEETGEGLLEIENNWYEGFLLWENGVNNLSTIHYNCVNPDELLKDC